VTSTSVSPSTPMHAKAHGAIRTISLREYLGGGPHGQKKLRRAARGLQWRHCSGGGIVGSKALDLLAHQHSIRQAGGILQGNCGCSLRKRLWHPADALTTFAELFSTTDAPPKTFRLGTHRAVTPATTVERLRSVRQSPPRQPARLMASLTIGSVDSLRLAFPSQDRAGP
jgi:hypothetical protein